MVVTSCPRFTREFRTVRCKGPEPHPANSPDRNADQSCARRGITSLRKSASERSACPSVMSPKNTKGGWYVAPGAAPRPPDCSAHALGPAGDHGPVGYTVRECRAARHIESGCQAGHAVPVTQPIQMCEMKLHRRFAETLCLLV